METTQASTIASGVIAVPTNYVELKHAYLSSTSPYQKLQRKTAEWIYDNYPYRSGEGEPRFIAREGSNFIFGPYASASYVVTLVYFNRLAPISSAVNSVFTAYPGLWLYGSLLEAEGFLKNDKRLPIWERRYQDLMMLIEKEDADEHLSGGVLSVTAG